MPSLPLKLALKRLGLTQRQFAQHCGYSEETVSRWCASGQEPRIVGLYVQLLLRLRDLSGLQE